MTSSEVLTGTMTSELIDSKRLWTLKVPVMPGIGQLIEWIEPACRSIPAQALWGWLTSQESIVDYALLIVAAKSTRWVRVSVVQLDEIKVLPAVHLGYLATVITGNTPDDFAQDSTVVNIKYDVPPRGHSIQKDVPASECIVIKEFVPDGLGYAFSADAQVTCTKPAADGSGVWVYSVRTGDQIGCVVFNGLHMDLQDGTGRMMSTKEMNLSKVLDLFVTEWSYGRILPSTPHKHDTDNGCCDVCGKWETDQPLAAARTSAYDNSVM
jgi:hypothetical protein